ncbi:alkylation response protein AidB-like acyl-CoA dehydrogenase [Neobacillus niacini]|uniref:acyl-CoA dehydrogenase family protein n=1 Tax=Neobacillus niacini TaxID=86668 RepID=UPI0028655157|nr:acyl-CoA dehydrogenase [Neobacillus niacini]MDR7076148.1 alkylation response protein AidB-like acyl-CoA dehydrogenase [Neobacillus niacini]
MDLQFTEEQSMLQQTARKFFENELTFELVDEAQHSNITKHSVDLWRKIAEMGWLGVAIDEQYNGIGGSLFDLGVIYEEAGRALLPTTFYSTIYASLLIEQLGTDEQKKRYLSQIAEGKMISTVAFSEADALYNPEFFITTARKLYDRWVLNGTKAFVPNADVADNILVIARLEEGKGNDGLIAFIVRPNDDGVTLKSMNTFGNDAQSVVTFNNVELDESNVLGGIERTEKTEESFELARKQATALQCMEMVGGARKVLDMTVNYVSERKQFGVPIGSFQAVQHHLANMATSVEGAQLATYQAMWLLSEGLEAEQELAIAKAFTSETYKSATLMAHQLWAGMGFALDSGLYLYSNRAKATELSFGTYDYHLKELSNLIAPAHLIKKDELVCR